MRKFMRGLVVLGLAAMVVACNDLTEVNTNPNDPEDVAVKYLVVDAIRETLYWTIAGPLSWRNTAIWAQHNVQIQYPEEDRYRFRAEEVDAYFRGLYTRPLRTLQRIEQKGESPNHVALALTLKSFIFQIMTDLWGDIPYTEALQIDADPPITTPVYDRQETIYQGLFRDLSQASALFDTGEPMFEVEDLIYGGDVERWRKFANSLRLRVAMRLSEVDPAKAREEFRAALQARGGVFESNADNAVLIYGTDPFSRHPFYEEWYAYNRDDYGISKSIVDIMLNGDTIARNDWSRHDPRLAVYAEKTESDSVYRGHRNGMMDRGGRSLSEFSRISERWQKRPDGDAVLMSYAEVLFLKAEAAERGWIDGDAEEFYLAAIRASMEYHGISKETFEAYMAAHPEWAYDYPGSTRLRQIGIQKWIALFTNGPEAFAEWRRTGYPELEPGPHIVPAAEGKILRRYPYSSLEHSLNNANQTAAVEAQGMRHFEDITVPVWWDKKAH